MESLWDRLFAKRVRIRAWVRVRLASLQTTAALMLTYTTSPEGTLILTLTLTLILILTLTLALTLTLTLILTLTDVAYPFVRGLMHFFYGHSLASKLGGVITLLRCVATPASMHPSKTAKSA